LAGWKTKAARGIGAEDFVKEKEAGKRFPLDKAMALAVSATGKEDVKSA
jgi:hypothetical protein